MIRRHNSTTMADMDPELEPFVALLPTVDPGDPVAARKQHETLAASVPADTTGLDVTDHLVGTGVPVRIYRPRAAVGAIVWLHGGGFVIGNLDTERPWASLLANASGVTVISVAYRLAPEHPFPAALDDAYEVLTWAADNAVQLGIDPARIAVGGHSAGGGLAAAVALRARDEGGPAIAFQLLHQAGLDDRLQSWSALNVPETPFASRAGTADMWRYYLGGEPATALSAPARATDLSGLPPAYVAAAELCPHRDEDVEYAMRLLQARVSVELHVWPGTFHGSQAIVSADISQRQNAELAGALRRGVSQ